MTGEQAFKRILKDIGIYTAYLDDRKRVGRKGFDYLPTEESFASIINCSFCWADTNHCTMWTRLYQSSPSNLPCKKMVNDRLTYDLYINCLNKIVKECI